MIYGCRRTITHHRDGIEKTRCFSLLVFQFRGFRGFEGCAADFSPVATSDWEENSTDVIGKY